MRLLGMQWHLILTLQISSSLPIGFIMVAVKSQQHTLTLSQNQPLLLCTTGTDANFHENLNKVFSAAQLRYGIFFWLSVDILWYPGGFSLDKGTFLLLFLNTVTALWEFFSNWKSAANKIKVVRWFIITSMSFYGRSLKIFKMLHLTF